MTVPVFVFMSLTYAAARVVWMGRQSVHPSSIDNGTKLNRLAGSERCNDGGRPCHRLRHALEPPSAHHFRTLTLYNTIRTKNTTKNTKNTYPGEKLVLRAGRWNSPNFRSFETDDKIFNDSMIRKKFLFKWRAAFHARFRKKVKEFSKFFLLPSVFHKNG